MARKIYETVTFPHTLPGGTGAADALTTYTPGYRGRIVRWAFVTQVAGTGSGATRTPNLEINAVNVTGSDGVALALADTSAVGEVKALGTPTALNEFDEDDTISIEWASGGTAFTAGSGAFLVVLEQKTRGI